MTLIDITRPMRTGMPVWPGDTAFSYEVSCSISESSLVNVGKLMMSTHTGTHVDAPFHYDKNGRKIAELDLSIFIGKALVVTMENQEILTAEDFKDIQLKGVERLLIKTNSWQNHLEFPEKYTYISPCLAEMLGNSGVRLLGVDVPSVDHFESSNLITHHALYKNSIVILESLQLKNVTDGIYELFAAPLNLTEADGSPVRAVLRSLEAEKATV